MSCPCFDFKCCQGIGTDIVGGCVWLRRDGSDADVRFGTNVVTVDDCLPGQWLRVNVLHYFTSTMKRTFKIKSSGLVFFSSYFLTLLFNEGHSDANVEDTFSYRNVATWLSKKMERSKTSLNGIKTLVFFQIVGHMHWVTYIIFHDLKIIEEFDSMGPSPSGTVFK
jgi:Ulp1 family protease